MYSKSCSASHLIRDSKRESPVGLDTPRRLGQVEGILRTHVTVILFVTSSKIYAQLISIYSGF